MKRAESQEEQPEDSARVLPRSLVQQERGSSSILRFVAAEISSINFDYAV